MEIVRDHVEMISEAKRPLYTMNVLKDAEDLQEATLLKIW
jgi:hypothetical protein